MNLFQIPHSISTIANGCVATSMDILDCYREGGKERLHRLLIDRGDGLPVNDCQTLEQYAYVHVLTYSPDIQFDASSKTYLRWRSLSDSTVYYALPRRRFFGVVYIRTDGPSHMTILHGWNATEIFILNSEVRGMHIAMFIIPCHGCIRVPIKDST